MDANRRQKLYEAIKKAQNPGGCEYIGPDKQPRCVVAQLAALEGIDVADAVRLMDGESLLSANTRGIGDMKPLREPLKEKGYPVQLLIKLQKVWDSVRGLSAPEREAKAARLKDQMRHTVDAWKDGWSE